uniref:Rab11 family GTPase putative n=1 Tax=Albugo laibachii Nc14 TaxID=890382 RepID=F0W164_9STRA|nr:Rab11 family GTPase putative [Albugo laibachii Nc14]|eukprot:CCA14789.1 Rab11 family GTPase putative [Albugo laibachii Nc14]
MTHIHSNQNRMEAMQSYPSVRPVLPNYKNGVNEIRTRRNRPSERPDSKTYPTNASPSRPTEVCPISSSYYNQLTSRSLSSNMDSPVSGSPLSSTTSFKDVTLTLKVVLIGDSQVGKSNLVLRFTNSTFHAHSEQTVGFEFATRTLRVGKRRIKVQVWDSSGKDRFQSLIAAYYRHAVGAMVVYDVTNRTSFENIERWLRQMQQYAHENLVMVLVGNKCDLAHLPNSRQVSTLEAARFADKYSMEFLETSALDSTNVIEAFRKLIVPVGRLLSPSNAKTIARLPAGWRRVRSRSRPGEYSYENQYTKERIAFAPEEAAKPSQHSFRFGPGIDTSVPTVTRELLQKQQKKAFLVHHNAPSCGFCTLTCVIS